MEKWKRAASASLLALGACFAAGTAAQAGDDWKVAGERVHLRSGPGMLHPTVAVLQKGASVQLAKQAGEWRRVRAGGAAGWLPAWELESARAPSAEIAIVRTASLNVRAEPSLASPVIRSLAQGDRCEVRSLASEWVEISLGASGGWVYRPYVALEAASPAHQEAHASERPRAFAVAVDELQLRAAPSPASSRTASLKKGAEGAIVAERDPWVQVKAGDQVGWALKFLGTIREGAPRLAAPALDSAHPSIAALYDGANIRARADEKSDVIGHAKAGESFSLIASEGDWHRVRLGDGREGYLSAAVSRRSGSNSLASPVQTGTLQGRTIVIDPGHGGRDRGTAGSLGTQEKELTLQVASALASKLSAAGARVVLTRTSDAYIDLRARVATAEHARADAFLSLHFDASLNRSVHGFTSYFYRDNQKPLAEAINGQLSRSLPIASRGARKGDFLVVRDNPLDAVLIELGFLSNAAEERTVANPAYGELAAQGIYSGLLDHFSKR